MSFKRKTITFLLVNIAIFTFALSPSSAIDPKFELDPRMLEERMVTPPGKSPDSGTSHAPRLKKTERKNNGRIHKNSKRNKRKNRIEARQRHNGKEMPAGKTERQLHATHIQTASGKLITLDEIRDLWGRIVPDLQGKNEPVEVAGRNFSLSLDPSRFPSLPTVDGGRILLDVHAALPFPVKALIRDEEPKVRIVSENPSKGKEFVRELLSAADFYSWEEDFTLDYGVDPKLTVIADYKIEPTPDSLLRNQTFLLNIDGNRSPVPESLKQFLGRDGFHVVESARSLRVSKPHGDPVLYNITDSDPTLIVDSILRALSIQFVPEKEIELDDGVTTGIKLSLKLDRYFEQGGKKIAVSFHDDDGVSKTLSALLQSNGYEVVMIDRRDDFKKIAEELLSGLHMRGHYGKHTLWPLEGNTYTIQVSGIRVETGRGNGGDLYLTDTAVDGFTRDLLVAKGFRVFANQ